MRIRLSKPFRILAISLAATIALIVATSVFVSLFYEQAVIRFMKKYLNEHLLTQISMDDIRFRALKGFPHATVEISNVVMLSGNHFSPGDFKASYADTLLKARKVSFQFDIYKLLRKNYELRKIEIDDGFVNVLFDNNGYHNLNVWKSESGKGNDHYAINLKSVMAVSMSVRYVDLRSGIELTSYTNKTAFRGSYIDDVLSGDAKGGFLRTSLQVKKKPWLNHALLQVEMKMIYARDHFRIQSGKVKINKAEIAVRGEYKNEKTGIIDLALDVPKFGLDEAMSLLPVKTDSLFRNFRFSGNGSLKATLKGPVSDPDRLQIFSEFQLNGCSARNLATRGEINHISVQGNVSGTQADNFRLTLQHFTSQLGKGTIGGKMEVRNLHQLNYQATLHADLDLDALQKFVHVDTLEYLNGMLHASFDASGSLGGFRSDSAARLLNDVRTGSFAFQNAGIKFRHSPISVRNLNGKATWRDVIYLDSITVNVNENDLRLNGTVQNLNGYLLEKGILRSDLKVSADKFLLNSFLRKEDNSNENTTPNQYAFFPARMHVNAQMQTANFEEGKFRATDLSLTLSLIGDSMYIPAFTLKFPDGSINGDALISQDRKHVLSVTCNSVSRQINIQQMFTAFNNFAQTFIIDKNVKGSLNGTVSFTAQWDSTLHFMSKNLKAKASLEVSNGELVQFEPMLKLSKYISVDELRLIRFKTLKNEIYIADRQVILPEMEIHSSAFNISVSGKHSFDNVFDYRMKVLLSEVLFNKARKKKKEMDEFLIEENHADQTTIPLIVAGTPDKFDVKFDRKRAFDLSRKSADKTPSNIPDAGNFKIEWDDEHKDPGAKTTPSKNQGQKDFTIEWDDDTTPNDNPK